MKLTKDLVFSKTGTDCVSLIRHLNLWGSDLDDISFISEMSSLEVLSLSVNHITTLQPFSACTHLRELYLRKNSISSVEELFYLTELKGLRVLWLLDNPISNLRNYRDIVKNILPQLSVLDDEDVDSTPPPAQENVVRESAIIPEKTTLKASSPTPSPKSPALPLATSSFFLDKHSQEPTEEPEIKPASFSSFFPLNLDKKVSFIEKQENLKGWKVKDDEDKGKVKNMIRHKNKPPQQWASGKADEIKSLIRTVGDKQHQIGKNNEGGVFKAVIHLVNELDQTELQLLKTEVSLLMQR